MCLVTNKQTDRQTDIQTDRQTEKETVYGQADLPSADGHAHADGLAQAGAGYGRLSHPKTSHSATGADVSLGWPGPRDPFARLQSWRNTCSPKSQHEVAGRLPCKALSKAQHAKHAEHARSMLAQLECSQKRNEQHCNMRLHQVTDRICWVGRHESVGCMSHSMQSMSVLNP